MTPTVSEVSPEAPRMTGLPRHLAPSVSIRGLTKRYGGVTVLHEVSLDIRAGEVHAIVGENGAGKSTLSKLLAGVIAPTAGAVQLCGESVLEFSPQSAERLGVVLIHQELALAEHLTVAENMFLGHELTRLGTLRTEEMNKRAGEVLAQLGCKAPATQIVSKLPVSDKQMVEIAKALLRRAKVLIMDEPTAVLTPRESEHLFSQINRLRAEGVSVVYISHKLEEVLRLADRVSILRDGRYQGTWDGSTLSAHQIANLMVGRELETIYPKRVSGSVSAAPAMSVRDFLGETSMAPANLDIYGGEILGVAGLVGSGRTELFESLVGLRAYRAGTRLLHDIEFRPLTYLQALRAGVSYITEDRKGRGLLLDESVSVNVSTLAPVLSGDKLVRPAREKEANLWAVANFSIEAAPNITVRRLSGGNQQKVLLAKYLLTKPHVIVIDEPTRGIDVGTRAQIYAMLRRLAVEGHAVVVISSDLQEILGLSDRIMVMHDHAIAGFVAAELATEELIVQMATGVAKKQETLQ